MGSIVTSNDEIAEKLAFIQNASGAVPGPMDCFLTLRGIKTLHVRMQRHCENCREIAEFLQKHKKIDKVYWPGLKTAGSLMLQKANERFWRNAFIYS